MRRARQLGLVVILVGLLAADRTLDAGAGGSQSARLRAAAGTLLAEPGKDQPDAGPPLTAIVGILTEVSAPELPQPLRTKLEALHARLLQGDSPLDPAVTAVLAEVYAALNGGRRFAFPADVKTIAQAKVACAREIDRSQAALDAGRPGEAGRGMVEFLMLVATPMERQ